MNRFKPHEFVRVINIDNEPFYWQYQPSSNEEETITPDGMHRQIFRGEPTRWMLNPGESDVLQGDNAYLMIEGLYKKLVAKKKVSETPDQPDTMARNFNWTDPLLAETWIDKIFLGKVTPTFGNEPTTAPEVTSTARPAKSGA